MTLTSPPRVRPTSSFSWVLAAAGWTVGVVGHPHTDRMWLVSNGSRASSSTTTS